MKSCGIRRTSRVLTGRYAALLVICLFLEIFIFNFRHWESLGFETLESYTVHYDSTFTESGSGTYTSSAGEMWITLSGLDEQVDNLRLDIQGAVLSLQLSVWDEGNTTGEEYPIREYHPEVEEESYIRLDTAGKVHKIRIALSNPDEHRISVGGIYLNQERPLIFRLDRFLFIMTAGWIVLALKKKDSILDAQLADRYPEGQMLYALTTTVLILASVSAVCVNDMAVGQPFAHHAQYAELAESMSRGHLYLDTDPQPPAELAAMDNPYDKQARDEQDVDFRWDTAYFDGKYYVYFGVVPVVMFYLPWYLLTGQALPNYVVICLGLIFVIAVMAALIWKLAWRIFKGRLPVIYVWLAFVQLAVGGAAAIVVRQASFYTIPILFGLGFGGAGVLCWLRAAKAGTKRPRMWIFLGALSLALIAGCRPQLLVIGFPALFALKDRFLGESGKERWKDMAAAAIPVMAVAAALMWYNMARFGSPWDFGSAYNLTTNDMTRRGIRLDRIGLILFTYFFQPVYLESQFPFISPAQVSTIYQGTTIMEPIFGGLLFLMPCTLCLFTLGSKKIRRSGLFPLLSVLTGMAVLVAVADGQLAGLLARYYMDFAALLLVAAFITGGIWISGLSAGHMRCRVLSGALLVGIVLCTLMIFQDGTGLAIEENMPYLYHKIMTGIQFWM